MPTAPFDFSSVIPKSTLFAIGFFLAVSMGYAVPWGSASLVSVDESYFDELNSGANPEVNSPLQPIAPKQADPSEYTQPMGASMTGSNIISGSGNDSIMAAFDGFCVDLSNSEKVYLRCWQWLPGPPEDDLLKVPISV